MATSGGGAGGLDLFGLFWLGFWVVFAIQNAWHFRQTLGQPPQWQPPGRWPWPFHIHRDAYRVWCIFWVVLSVVCVVVTLVVLT